MQLREAKSFQYCGCRELAFCCGTGFARPGLPQLYRRNIMCSLFCRAIEFIGSRVSYEPIARFFFSHASATMICSNMDRTLIRVGIGRHPSHEEKASSSVFGDSLSMNDAMQCGHRFCTGSFRYRRERSRPEQRRE